MKALILSGDFIRPQLLMETGGGVVDLEKWLKADARGRKKLRHKIVGADTEHTRIEVLSDEDFKTVISLMVASKLRK